MRSKFRKHENRFRSQNSNDRNEGVVVGRSAGELMVTSDQIQNMVRVVRGSG